MRRHASRAARRSTRRSIRRGIALPLAAAAQPLIHHVVHRHTRFGDVIQSRLSLVLHVHRALMTAGAAARRDQPSASPASRLAGGVAGSDQPRRAASIVARLPLRATRLEAATSLFRSAAGVVTRRHTDASGRTDAGPRAAAAMTLPRQHDNSPRRHESATTTATRSDHAALPDDRGGRATPHGRTRRDEVPVLPDGEIERLAERVIGSIDRRIAAQRERVGRF
jgi:hypothetical protein